MSLESKEGAVTRMLTGSRARNAFPVASTLAPGCCCCCCCADEDVSSVDRAAGGPVTEVVVLTPLTSSPSSASSRDVCSTFSSDSSFAYSFFN